jgi:hypothetical protein
MSLASQQFVDSLRQFQQLSRVLLNRCLSTQFFPFFLVLLHRCLPEKHFDRRDGLYSHKYPLSGIQYWLLGKRRSRGLTTRILAVQQIVWLEVSFHLAVGAGSFPTRRLWHHTERVKPGFLKYCVVYFTVCELLQAVRALHNPARHCLISSKAVSIGMRAAGKRMPPVPAENHLTPFNGSTHTHMMCQAYISFLVLNLTCRTISRQKPACHP